MWLRSWFDKIWNKVFKIFSVRELIFISIINAITGPFIIWGLGTDLLFDDKGVLTNLGAMVFEVTYGLQLAFLLGAYFFYKERKTEEKSQKANAIISIEERKWKEFLNEDVKSFSNSVQLFIDVIDKDLNIEALSMAYKGANSKRNIISQRLPDFSRQLSGELEREIKKILDSYHKIHSNRNSITDPIVGLIVNNLKKELSNFNKRFEIDS